MRYLLLMCSLFLIGCNNKDRVKINDKKNFIDSLREHKDAVRKFYDIESIKDSIQLDSMLSVASSYANKHLKSNSFSKSLVNWRSPMDSVILRFGDLFNTRSKYLVVRQVLHSETVGIVVFVVKENKLLVTRKEPVEIHTFIRYVIADVNGDNYKDLLINTYSTSGCCARSFHDVYLYLPRSATLSDSYGFMNPTFFSVKKIIRGVDYGHPGEVPLYKYKWNGSNVDTIEWIMPNVKGKNYHVFYRWKDVDNPNSGKYLNIVPKEYHHIESYDWFKGIY